MEMKETIVEKLKKNFGDTVQDVTDFRNELSITIASNKIVDVAKFLKEDPELEFVMCKDVTAIDWATRKNRFTVVYHVYSFKNNYFLRLKSNIVEETPVIDSVTSIWPSANWYERETFDMYGIVFNNHPDLRRMYMPEGFQYHPLRKDFPVLGIPGSLPLPEKI
ncbi:MAG: NADH-quinone oxidoreductase subunit C [Melioribacter sp.]|nr:NADH-quinone oxidoreductase subunit C [Melioribacter sp.]